MLQIRVSYDNQAEVEAFLQMLPPAAIGRKKPQSRSDHYQRVYVELYPFLASDLVKENAEKPSK